MSLLEQKLQNLPNSAGIYQYFDINGKLLYIGKAKVLKNRVKSYFRFTPSLQPSPTLGSRIHKMISEVYDLSYIVVNSENDALILENSLIKQLKPKYNILLRDDKTYPYIYVDTSEDFPRLDITRKIIKSKSIKYYGPFSSGARDLLDTIYDIVPLVQKKSCVKGKKACMFYQIKKCLAPCENKITKEDYKTILDEALELITNKEKTVQLLEQKMQEYSLNLRFEDAMDCRNKIATISKSQVKSTLDLARSEDLDLFAVEQASNKAVVVKMFIRNGKLISTTHNFVTTTEISEKEEIYKTALVNYYNSELPLIPTNIFLCDELEDYEEIENFIQSKHSKKVKISSPKIGIKKQLCDVAKNNCVELLKIVNTSSTSILYAQIKELLDLYKIPARFECFDNSQMMGQAKVGSMIVWDQENFFKDDYRVYNLEANDEYHQMQEMLTRRAKSFDSNPPPDMWVIDGGKTLLELAISIVQSSGANIDVVAIAKEKIDAKAHRAKGSAKDILYTSTQVFTLEPSDKRLQFFQRLRDEAHRSAITFHKKQKRKEDKQISLLDIHGIAQGKVKKLISYFGTFENIKEATIEELENVLNAKDAFEVFNYFH
ncbi:MAG: excinuclease ABC subunit UvrC [Campylobacterales bacterium]|nr:excinuclease ABC subunit UvrC [Campylobacterales bacterium]